MTLDWPNLVVGAILGFLVGFLAHWAFVEWEKWKARRALRVRYSRLPGSYANFRLKDGEYKATGGTITLSWQRDGSFAVKGLHPDGTEDWAGIIRMKLNNTGTGDFRTIQKSHGHGTQTVTYTPHTGYFDVRTDFTSQSSPAPFYHQWRRKEG
jgi:hypothetical protein